MVGTSKNWQHMNKLISLLLVLIIPLCFALCPIKQVLAAGSVDLTLATATQTVKLGDTFDVVIQAQSGSQEVVGADVFLNFDPSRLEVVDIDNVTAGTQILGGLSLTTELWNSADSSSGQIDYSAGKFISFPKGTFTIATVCFRALGTASPIDTVVDFSTSFDRPTKVVGDVKATNVTGTLIGSVYSLISPAIPVPPSGGGFVFSGSTQNIIYTQGFSSPAVLSSNNEGKVPDTTTLVTSDGKASLFINSGTGLLDSLGSPLLLLTAESMAEPPSLPSLSKLIEAYISEPERSPF